MSIFRESYAVLHANGRVQVVEGAAVELKELDEENAQVEWGRSGERRTSLDARVQLQEAHGHDDEAVGADAARPDLVEAALHEKLLEHQH